MELKELEGKLDTQQIELESKAAGVKAKTAKDLEKEISERYSNEIRDKEDKWRVREAELKGQIDQLERELTKVTVDLKIKQDQAKLVNMSDPEAREEIERKLAEMQAKERESLIIRSSIGKREVGTQRQGGRGEPAARGHQQEGGGDGQARRGPPVQGQAVDRRED